MNTIPRRPNSVRRTSTVDLRWPGEIGSELRGFGRARDLGSGADGAVTELGSAEFHVELDPMTREVRSLDSTPPRPALQRLVGLRSGWRSTMAEAIPEDVAAGSPLYQALDDLSGANVVTSAVFVALLEPDDLEARFGHAKVATNTCLGFAEGTSAHDLQLSVDRAVPLSAPTVRRADPDDAPSDHGAHHDDPHAWHELPEWDAPFTRRARRIDVWRDDQALHVDSWFRDTRHIPGREIAVIHEYRVIAQADPVTAELRSAQAIPGTLPYWECPQAVGNLDRLIGMPLPALRRNVFRELRGTLGCTHLNDSMRALTDAPALLEHLDSPAAIR